MSLTDQGPPAALAGRRSDLVRRRERVIDASRNLLADQVRSYFRDDLDALGGTRSEDAVTTIAVLTSVESWHQSTHSHGRGPADTRRAWISAISAVFASGPTTEETES